MSYLGKDRLMTSVDEANSTGGMDGQENKDNSTPMALGEKIKAFRLGRNYTIEELAKETFVSIEFIKDIESGCYKKVPALAYTVGLLTNLLERMKLDAEQISSLVSELEVYYTESERESGDSDKNIRRDGGVDSGLEGESEEQKSRMSLWMMIGLIGLAVLGLLLFYFYQQKTLSHSIDGDIQTKVEKNQQLGEEEKLKESFNFYEDSATYTLGEGDEVKVFFDNEVYSFVVKQLDLVNEPKLTLVYKNDKSILLSLFQEDRIRLNDDEKKDLLIKFQQVSGELTVVYFALINKNLKNTDYAQIWNQQEKTVVDEAEHLLMENQERGVIVSFIKATSLPIYLSYNIDGQRQNTIQLKPGNQVSIVAQDHLEIQIGNFRSAQLVVNRIPIQLKISGDQFSITKIIKWVPSVNNETRSDLMIKNFIN